MGADEAHTQPKRPTNRERYALVEMMLATAIRAARLLLLDFVFAIPK
jgi:hypothetical protein